MPSRCSWSAAEGAAARGVLAWLLLAAAATAPARPATLLERSVRHSIQGDGSVVEEVSLSVRLESAADYRSWIPFPVYLDERRRLEELSAAAVLPDGERLEPKKKDHDTLDVPAAGVLHDSGRYRVVRFPPLPAGSTLEVHYRVASEPYFPGGRVSLLSEEPTASLRVEVRGAPPGWHWSLAGGDGLVHVEELADGVRLSGEDLPALDPPDRAPAAANLGPVLRYAWGAPAQGWEGVGRWYEKLLAGLPRQAPSVDREASRAIAGLERPRQRLEALLGIARKQVRYVAVEVGVGGYRPTPPEEVLERGWGDCKDKSLLLVDLLADAGIEAFPALVGTGGGSGVDPGFASPLGFNHMIVAVPAEAVGAAPGEPVAEGYLFVDPTQERGSAAWLHPAVQGRSALVVRSDGARLVTTPVRGATETRRLSVEATLDAAGDGRGRALLVLGGRWADGVLASLAGASPETAQTRLRAVFDGLLPGAVPGAVDWRGDGGGVPSAELSAEVRWSGLARGRAGRLSVRLPGLLGTPSPSLLEDRREPIVVTPGVTEVAWRLHPPGPCTLESAVRDPVDNEVGSFVQSVRQEEGTVVVESRTEVRPRLVGPDLFDALAELALAEHRAGKRRLRLRCGEASTAPPAP